MKWRCAGLVFAAALALYGATARFGFVQDDRAIVAANPAAHTPPAALRAFARPYWPPPSEGGLWRPVTVLSFAVDWWLSNGRASWLHLANAVWHGIACVLVLVVMGRFIDSRGACIAALVFAVHPVHVEAVAGLVGRAELLAACAILGATAAALHRKLLLALFLAGAAMLAKEHGVVIGGVILLADWLHGERKLELPRRFYAALAAITIVYLVSWHAVGGAAARDVAPPFLHASLGGRLAIALPALLRAAMLLVWPARLSADYNPQVIPVHHGASLAALGGIAVAAGVIALLWGSRRRWPGVGLAAGIAALSCLPTANLLFASGVVLAERNLYLAVLLPAVAVGVTAAALLPRRPVPATLLVVGIVGALAARSWTRLPAWRDNRTHLVTLLAEHPESYRAHASAAAVYAGMGDTAEARRSYERATALFAGDPHLLAARALFLLGQGDTATAGALTDRARTLLPRERVALRTDYALALLRGDLAHGRALADTARTWFPADSAWYSAVK